MKKATLNNRIIKTELIEWKDLKFIQQDGFKDITSTDSTRLKKSIISNDFAQPFFVCKLEDGIYCLDGKHRTIALYELIEEGYNIPDQLPATFLYCESIKEAAKLVLIFSSMYAKVSAEGFKEFTELYDFKIETLFDEISLPDFDELDFVIKENNIAKNVNDLKNSLSERFLIPPFSIFDSRQGYWQDRKKVWSSLFNSQASREDIELIAKSGQSPAIYNLRNKMRDALGRDPNWDEILDYAKKKGMHIYSGASIFDPVLTEILYTWFCPNDAKILDPFAGGCVRGIVAGMLGHQYHGIDLRPEQVIENRKEAERLNVPGIAWFTGDSNEVLKDIEDEYDFVFSCPPYFDLEQYSDDPADLSNMDYPEFINIYRSIITKSIAKLKPNRFACFVVGDIRSKDGAYRNFVSETIDCFTKCIDSEGSQVKLYNEIILINVAGSLPIRISGQFEGGRKVGKMHQNVLVFYKGDIQKIKNEFPLIKVKELLEELENKPNIEELIS